ncbi:MAG: M28 family metallopeptidase [Gammaproteobacteria bacterium]
MSKLYSTLLLILVTSGATFGFTNAQTGLPQANPARVEAHIKFLADDYLGGRDTGTAGFEIAARYVASEFAQIGVQPAGNNGSYFQDISFRRAYRDLDAASMVVHTAEGDEVFQFREEFVSGAPMARTEEALTAPLVFAGYGIESDWLNHHDYEGLNVDGKVVVVLAGRPESFPSEEGAHFGSGAEKRKAAADRGAVGMITLWTPLSNRLNPFPRLSRNLHQPSVSVLNRDGTVAGSDSAFRGGAALSLEAGARLFDLADRSLEEVFATIDRGETPEGFELPLSVTLERASRHETITSPNILGVIEGSDPVLKNEYVTFTAHLDHVGPASGDGDDLIHNGALDNAAGVAALLENARLLMSLPEKPRRSIMFVIVTAEEKGLLGAQYFAENPTVPIQNIVANINLDMPLILYPFNNVIAFGAQHSTLRENLQRALQGMGLSLMDDPMPAEAIFVRSDHYRFVQQGIPAVMLATGYGSDDPALNGEEIWGNFLQTHYHQVSDSTNLPIDYAAGARFAQVNFMVGLDVANADERPRWNSGDFFGNEFGREWSQ